MARASRRLAGALRATAARLRGGAPFQWSHMGRCSCGHLAQTLTALPAASIHRMALERAGDWGEQAVDRCAASGLPIDHVFGTLLEAGLDRADIAHLEDLSGARVLRRLPRAERHLDRARRADVVRYLEAFADALAEEMGPEASSTREGAGTSTSTTPTPSVPRERRAGPAEEGRLVAAGAR